MMQLPCCRHVLKLNPFYKKKKKNEIITRIHSSELLTSVTKIYVNNFFYIVSELQLDETVTVYKLKLCISVKMVILLHIILKYVELKDR